jgi:hypothetical protein
MQQRHKTFSTNGSIHQLSPILVFISILIFQTSWGHNADSPSPNTPAIEFTFIPPYGSSDDLRGRVRNVDLNHKVAVYIFVEGAGWWTKPNFAQPLTTIQSDSTWTCDITTGGNDAYATKIHAFLLPNGVNPPQAGGLPDLPPSLSTISVANVSATRSPKAISFSGHAWWVKGSAVPVGPGPNYFSDSAENVWVDSLGQLHLKMTQRNGRWHCSEVVLKNSLGYGRYVFQITGKVGRLDPNVVLGLFTWDNASAEFHREIDIEFARWGVATDPNAQYVVQPWDRPGNRQRWMIPTALDFSTHGFIWRPDSIAFLSAKGHQTAAPPDSIIYSWNYKGPNIPTHGNENARINLWLFNGQAPTDTAEVEVIIKKFIYDARTSVDERRGSMPSRYYLSHNHPNPFTVSTRIRYSIPQASQVSLKVYDLAGREVDVLVDHRDFAGEHEVVWQARNLPNGIYFYRLESERQVETKKLLVLR